MSGKKDGPSNFARHIDEGLAQLPGDIKRATQMKLMQVLHEGQRQAEDRQEMFQQMPNFPQQQQQKVAPIQPQLQSYLPSSTSRQYPPRMVSQSHQWQPPPSQWSAQQMPGEQPTSVWGSQDSHYMSSQYPALYPQPSSQPSVSSPKILDLDTSDILSTAMTTAGMTTISCDPSGNSSTSTWRWWYNQEVNVTLTLVNTDTLKYCVDSWLLYGDVIHQLGDCSG